MSKGLSGGHMADFSTIEGDLPDGRPLDESVRIESYLPLVHSRVNAFRHCGIEPDDLFQEGIIGLLNAVRSYRPECGASFETFAYTCITNRLRSAVTAAGRNIYAVSYDEWQNSEHPLSEEPEVGADPQEIVAGREEMARWRQMVSQRLSDFERRAIGLFLNGYSYEEIAVVLHHPVKAVDNALQRARRKLRE